MSKTFAQAPKPKPLADNVIAAFERRGAGQDTRTHIAPIVGLGETTNVEMGESTNPAATEPTNVGKTEHPNVGMLNSSDVVLGHPTNVVEEPTRRLSIDLPQSWHRRFKTACSKADKKMIAEVTDFIKRRTVELEKE